MDERKIVMDSPIIRIDRIVISDMKSVGYGEIDFRTKEAVLSGQPSVMGIYGQNASGKTTAVEALALIKRLLSGETMLRAYLDHISCGKEKCELEISFSIESMDEQTQCTAVYRCGLAKKSDPNDDKETIPFLSDESIKIAGKIDGKVYALQAIAETDEEEPIIRPESKRKLLFGVERKDLEEIRNIKYNASLQSRSFIFSAAALSKMQENEESVNYKRILQWMRAFAREKLFVVSEDKYGSQVMRLTDHFTNEPGFADAFPVWVAYGDSGRWTCGTISVALWGRTYLPEDSYKVLCATIDGVNQVLEGLVPGLTIEVSKTNEQTGENGEQECFVELFSSRKDCGKFPLRLESGGIKKLVSILSLLIAVHNHPQISLVVDELDAGVFEYLLGELVEEIRDRGKGQLIFTSHNLRPLEKLDRKSICFTTNEPQKRFIKLKSSQGKQSNNLRDVYYRYVGLGTEDMCLYDGVSRHELGYAFKKAGRKE